MKNSKNRFAELKLSLMIKFTGNNNEAETLVYGQAVEYPYLLKIIPIDRAHHSVKGREFEFN